MKMNTEDCDEEFERRMKNLAPNNCCTLIYTVSDCMFSSFI